MKPAARTGIVSAPEVCVDPAAIRRSGACPMWATFLPSVITVAITTCALALWAGTTPADAQTPVCPPGYYYASDGQCYPGAQPAYPPPVYEVAPPVFLPPVIFDGFGVGIGPGWHGGGGYRGGEWHGGGGGHR